MLRQIWSRDLDPAQQRLLFQVRQEEVPQHQEVWEKVRGGQELARRKEAEGGGGKGGEKSKEIREIESQLKFLAGMDDEEASKARKTLEERLAAEKAKTPPKSPSALLRAAEAKRAAAAKAKAKAQDETEAVFKARQELEIRAAKAIAAEASTQAALDEADTELEETRRSVAGSDGAGITMSEDQAKAVVKQAEMALTVLLDARKALGGEALKELQPAGRAIVETLIGVLHGLGTALPPELLRSLSTTAVGEEGAKADGWNVAGADGKPIKQ